LVEEWQAPVVFEHRPPQMISSKQFQRCLESYLLSSHMADNLSVLNAPLLDTPWRVG
jgi:hypothetical protein